MRTTISQSELKAFARTLGTDPNETRSVLLEGDKVTVVTYKLNAQGGRYLDKATDDAAVETTVIKVVADDGKTVRMRHPNLPPGQEIDVRPRGVGQRAMAGWEVVAPFHAGGVLPSGVGLVTNASGKPEPVITASPGEPRASEPPPPGGKPEAPAEPGASPSPPRGRRKSSKEGE